MYSPSTLREVTVVDGVGPNNRLPSSGRGAHVRARRSARSPGVYTSVYFESGRHAVRFTVLLT